MKDINNIQKAQQIAALYGATPNDIEKGGEGSKGGKVIGHTKSGKPVYENADHASHSSFSKQDHQNAAVLHERHEQTHIQAWHQERQKQIAKLNETRPTKHADESQQKIGKESVFHRALGADDKANPKNATNALQTKIDHHAKQRIAHRKAAKQSE